MGMLSEIPAAVYTECKFKAGVWSGDIEPSQFYDPCNFTSLELTPPKQEKVQVLSNMEGSVGEALSTVFKTSAPGAVKGVVNSMDQTLGAIILGADVAALSQTGAAVTDEAVTTVLGVWAPLANKYLAAAGFELKDPLDATVDASKYEVDTLAGLIKATHADAVGECTVNYSTDDAAGRTFSSGKSKQVYLQLRGSATEKKTGKRGYIQIHQIACVSDQALDLAKAGHWEGTLSGDMITPVGKSSPWEFVALD